MHKTARIPRWSPNRLSQVVCTAALSHAAFGVTACSADALPTRDLGSTSERLDDNLGESTTDRIDIVRDGAIDPFIVGRWVGKAEDLFSPVGLDAQRPAYSFPSGSADITLDLELGDPASPTPYGQLVFGSGTVPAPESGVAYPPAFNYWYTGQATTNKLLLPPLEGFSYGLTESLARIADSEGVSISGALAIGYEQNEHLAEWCGLQPALSNGNEGFTCSGVASLAGGDPLSGEPCINFLPDGTQEPLDCNLVAACRPESGICTCTAASCNADRELINQLWLIRDGDDLIGTFAGSVFDYGVVGRFMPIGSVRFERVEP
jgi:hypothetical protein